MIIGGQMDVIITKGSIYQDRSSTFHQNPDFYDKIFKIQKPLWTTFNRCKPLQVALNRSRTKISLLPSSTSCRLFFHSCQNFCSFFLYFSTFARYFGFFFALESFCELSAETKRGFKLRSINCKLGL